MVRNEWQVCNVTDNNHSISAGEFYVTSTKRTLRKSYLGSSGQASFSSCFLEGRVPANKEIHERGSNGGVHEFVLVLWSGTQF